MSGIDAATATYTCNELSNAYAYANGTYAGQQSNCENQGYAEQRFAAQRTVESDTRAEPAARFDDGKTRYDLIPPEALEELARVYTSGCAKYGDRNWEAGMSWGRCFAALMRHAWKFWRGEDRDPETGCHHMGHVAWNSFSLLTYYIRGVGTDDRKAP